MTRKLAKKVVFLMALAYCFMACSSDVVYTKIYSIDEDGWDSEDAKSFEIPITNASLKYDMFIVLRNNEKYPYSNIFLIVDWTDSNGDKIADTLEYKMADAEGAWLGEGFSVKESKLIYKERVVFADEETHTYKLSHAVRDHGAEAGVKKLKGITDVGFIVQKSNLNEQK